MPLCDYVRLLQLYANRLLIASFGAMEEIVVSPKKSVNGCCAFSDECKCRMFRCPVASEPYKCFCTHDISQHEMIGVMDGAEVRYFGAAAAIPPPAPFAAAATKDTIELQRREMFLPYAHSGPSTINRSGGSKRPLSRAPDRPARSSVGRAPVETNLVNIICLRREDKIPTNDLERLEMGADYLQAVPLTTHAKLLKVLKLSSTLGEDLATKYYFFVQDTKRAIRATKYWSKNFPDDATIGCLSKLPCIYIVPNIYDDEENNFTDPADSDYVEFITSDLLDDSI